MANFWTSPNRDLKGHLDLQSAFPALREVHLGTLSQRLSQNLLLLLPNTIPITLSTIRVALSENVTITIVDPVDPNAASSAAQLLQESGYYIPGNENSATTTVNKKDAVGALGKVTIRQIGENSDDVLETWVLNNAWIEGVNFSDLSYDDEELSTIELTIRYDWASLSTKESDGSTNEYFLTTQTPS